MTIDWKKCPETMPEDKQECILYSDVTDGLVGPIMYEAVMGGWVDLWATKEAGHVFRPGPGGPTHWAPFNEPAALPTD